MFFKAVNQVLVRLWALPRSRFDRSWFLVMGELWLRDGGVYVQRRRGFAFVVMAGADRMCE